MATIRELGFCNLNSRADFQAIKKFFQHEQFDDRFLEEEMEMTEILFPPPVAEELQGIRQRITKDYDVPGGYVSEIIAVQLFQREEIFCITAL